MIDCDYKALRVQASLLPKWAQLRLKDLESICSVFEKPIVERNFPGCRFPNWMQSGGLEATNKVPEWINSFLEKADGELRCLWLESGLLREDTPWLWELLNREKGRVSKIFLVTGNINDYCFDPDDGYMPAIELIKKTVLKSKEWVLKYSLSNRFSPDHNNMVDMQKNNLPVIIGLPCAGKADVDGPAGNPMDVLRQDFQLIEKAFDYNPNQGVCVIIENLHLMLGEQMNSMERNVLIDALLRWSQSSRMFGSKNLVILLAETAESLSEELKSQGSQIDRIEIKRPEYEDRLKFLTSIYAGANIRPIKGIRWDSGSKQCPDFADEFGMDTTSKLKRFADRTSGLSLVGIENLILNADMLQDRLLTSKFVSDQKRKLLSEESAGLLTVTEPDMGTDPEKAFEGVGGLEMVKERLMQISRALQKKGEDSTIKRAIPKGMLFIGPPGTGKTLVARAFANAGGVPFAEMGDFRGQYVGQSERNLSTIFRMLRSLKPVVVFMDEIDQSEGQRGGQGDAGVSRRIFSKLLQFMSDPDLEGEVIWIGASNRADQIDAAMKRAGRFDLIIPFLLPDEPTRKDIFIKKFQEREVELQLAEKDWAQVVRLSHSFTGAEIEALVKEAVWRALAGAGVFDVDGKPKSVRIALKDMLKAFEVYRPTANREEYDRQTELTISEVTCIDLLPLEYQKKRDELDKRLGRILTNT